MEENGDFRTYPHLSQYISTIDADFNSLNIATLKSNDCGRCYIVDFHDFLPKVTQIAFVAIVSADQTRFLRK
jgi:hypothetical protein